MNASIHRFEDLGVWSEGLDFAAQIYQLTADWRDYGLKDQMQRAAVSIPSNVAEGYERGSNREFIQFLNYAKGSGGELRTQIHLAERLGRIDEARREELLGRSRKISAMLHRLIQVRKRDF